MGLRDVLDLRDNDLDTFVEDCFMLLGDHPCSLDYTHLDRNRVTTEAALWLIRTLQKRQAFDNKILELTLYGNPIDDCDRVRAAAADAGVVCEVDACKTQEHAKLASDGKDSWAAYFRGPAQLLRTNCWIDWRACHWQSVPFATAS